MKILILSDLHIGQKARGKDLCPNGNVAFPKNREGYNFNKNL